MHRATNLAFLFRVVAVIELIYALLGGLLPPSLVQSVTGWVLSPDGHWVTKLMSMALFSQAWVAWTLRDAPHRGVARALGFYQIASATVDWVMWIALADQGIFSSAQGKIGVILSIPTHYTLGFLLLLAVRRSDPGEARS